MHSYQPFQRSGIIRFLSSRLNFNGLFPERPQSGAHHPERRSSPAWQLPAGTSAAASPIGEGLSGIDCRNVLSVPHLCSSKTAGSWR
jgi:hypothetical protein